MSTLALSIQGRRIMNKGETLEYKANLGSIVKILSSLKTKSNMKTNKQMNNNKKRLKNKIKTNHTCIKTNYCAR